MLQIQTFGTTDVIQNPLKGRCDVSLSSHLQNKWYRCRHGILRVYTSITTRLAPHLTFKGFWLTLHIIQTEISSGVETTIDAYFNLPSECVNDDDIVLTKVNKGRCVKCKQSLYAVSL